MAKLILTYLDLYTKVSNVLGFTPIGTAPTGTNLTTCKDIVARAYRQFLYPISNQTGELHVWSFVKQLHVISTVSGKYKYELPLKFSDLLDIPHFDDEQGYRELGKVGPEQILEQRAASISTGYPINFALAPFTFDAKIGTYYEMWLDPVPDGAYLLKFFYRIDPLKPEATTDLLMGGVRATEAILETCLAVGEKEIEEAPGIHTAESARLIQELIRSDVQDTSDFLGNLSRPRPTGFRWFSATDPTTVYESEGGI